MLFKIFRLLLSVEWQKPTFKLLQILPLGTVLRAGFMILPELKQHVMPYEWHWIQIPEYTRAEEVLTVRVEPPGSLSMRFSRQECCSGLPFPPPGDLPDLGIEPASLMSPELAGRFITTIATWEALKPSSCAFFYTDAFDLYLDLFAQTRFWASPPVPHAWEFLAAFYSLCGQVLSARAWVWGPLRADSVTKTEYKMTQEVG